MNLTMCIYAFLEQISYKKVYTLTGTHVPFSFRDLETYIIISTDS